MRDLLITDNDLTIEGFDLALSDGTQAVKQRLAQKFRLWLGEWFLDTTAGVPWIPDVLGEQPREVVIGAILREVVKGDPAVSELISLDADLTQGRELTISFRARLVTGETISDAISPIPDPPEPESIFSTDLTDASLFANIDGEVGFDGTAYRISGNPASAEATGVDAPTFSAFRWSLAAFDANDTNGTGAIFNRGAGGAYVVTALAGQWQLVNSAVGVLDSWPGDPQAGDQVVISRSANGINVSINGTQRLSSADDQHLAQGGIGVLIGDSGRVGVHSNNDLFEVVA